LHKKLELIRYVDV